MARRKTAAAPPEPGDNVTDYRYDAKRKHIPPAGLASQGKVAEVPKTRYAHDPYLPPVLRFDATDYTDLLASTRANETRLKSASEFGRSKLSGNGFAGTLLRQVFYAVTQTVKAEETRAGLDWLKTELADYWGSRDKVIRLLDYFAGLRYVDSMAQWAKDAAAAGLLAGAVRNDHV